MNISRSIFTFLVIGAIFFPNITRPEDNRLSSSFKAHYTDLLTGMEFIFVKGGCFAMGDTFMARLSQATGKKFRLPTEAEWEYACRSGGKRERYAEFSEKDRIFRYANFCDVNCNYDWATADHDDRHKHAAPAGSFLPNDLGLYDMSGNVWEWVADWFDEGYHEKKSKI